MVAAATSESAAAFSDVISQDWPIPVKFTFIHFDVTGRQLSKGSTRAGTCPPTPQSSRGSDSAFTWDDATQELCHCMVPRWQTKVPAALGLKYTDSPLFKVEKLFKEALSPDVDIDAWTLATDEFIQHSTSAQEYAYTASFGEYNPSGGKDQVAKYMDLSKNELVLARDALKSILLQAGQKL